jgi:hypothetical protein
VECSFTVTQSTGRCKAEMNRLNCKQLLTCYMLKFSIVALHAVCIRKKREKKTENMVSSLF